MTNSTHFPARLDAPIVCDMSTAEDTPDGLTLVKVDTIDDALGALKDIRSGKTADLPKCTRG